MILNVKYSEIVLCTDCHRYTVLCIFFACLIVNVMLHVLLGSILSHYFTVSNVVLCVMFTWYMLIDVD